MIVFNVKIIYYDIIVAYIMKMLYHNIYCEYDIKLFLENKLEPTAKQILIC